MISASRRAALMGALVAALATLPGLGAGTLWDNSETAYGEVAREVLLTGDWIVLHFNGAPWFVQPPLYFWVAALIAKLLGPTELAFRLPAALATIAMSGAVGYVVARIASGRAAILAATILSTALMQAIVGRLAIMDALLDLFVALAILAWFAALRTGGNLWWYAGWIAVALGTLTKGPVAPALTFLVVGPWAFWDRAMLRPIRWPGIGQWAGGLAAFAAVVGPWALALIRAAGPGAFAVMLGHYTVGRYLGTIENQSGPFWYYVPVIILGFFPWIVFLIPATLDAWRAARADTNGSLARLALVWGVLPLVFFSFAQTKLPNYVALELPALAILVALWLDRVVGSDDRRAAIAWTATVPVAIAMLGFAIWAFSLDNRLGAGLAQIRTGMLYLGFALTAGSLGCVGLLTRRNLAPYAPFGLGMASIAVLLIIALNEPLVEPYKPIPPLAAEIDRERRAGDVVAIQGVNGGNALIFYTEPVVTHIASPGDSPQPEGPDDPRRTICSAKRAFVVTTKERPAADPTYGRTRRTIAQSGKDVAFLYDGPACTP